MHRLQAHPPDLKTFARPQTDQRFGAVKHRGPVLVCQIGVGQELHPQIVERVTGVLLDQLRQCVVRRRAVEEFGPSRRSGVPSRSSMRPPMTQIHELLPRQPTHAQQFLRDVLNQRAVERHETLGECFRAFEEPLRGRAVEVSVLGGEDL
jgi:hypothetical protein